MSISIRKYLSTSHIVESVNSTYLPSKQFLELYQLANFEVERKPLLFHVIRFNTPYIFKDNPLVYEQIRLYLSERLNLEVADIMLIGSAKTGFSMSPDEYGKAFSEKSDLDFTIVNQHLFEQLKDEYINWRNLYLIEKRIVPNNDTEQRYWDENLKVVEKNINNGFVDTRKLPNRNCCPIVKDINHSMWLIPERLRKCFNMTVAHASVRVYKDQQSFYNQFKRNTDCLLKLPDKE